MAWRSWYVALCDEADVFDPVAHRRRDLPVARIRISETEEAGQAMLSLTLAQQVTNLRGPGSHEWVLLSRELQDGSLQLMCRGHLVGTPLRGATEDGLPVVEYRCSPIDWRTPEAAACAAMELLPYYDPVLVAPARRADPREILDGWYATVHCARDAATPAFAFTTPEKLGGGLPVFTFDSPLIDPLPQAHQREAPVSEVDITLTCEFVQTGSGTLDVSSLVKGAFPWGFLDTLTPEALEKSWFKAGSKVGGDSGWTIVQSSLTRLDPQAFPAQIPSNAPLQAGPFMGAPERQRYVSYYSWVNDTTKTQSYTLQTADGRQIKRFDYTSGQSGDPGNLHGAPHVYDRVYYDCQLVAAWTVRQKRSETVRIRLINGCQALAPGPVRTLTLKCEDVTDDSSTLYWAPLTAYKSGDVRRVGYAYVQCLADHVSAQVWALDQTLAGANGVATTLWTQLPGLLSPLVDRTLASYLQTPRGLQTIQAAMAKGRRILADSTRNVDVTFRCALDDDSLLSLTTAAAGEVTVPSDLLDGGGAAGKVVSVTFESDNIDDHVDVTLRCAVGTGQAPVVSAVAYDANGQPIATPPPITDSVTFNASSQPWDQLSIGNVASPAQAPIPFPPITAQAGMAYGADGQSQAVLANDFVYNDNTRNDDRRNEPDTILRAFPTRLIVQYTQVSGRPTMYNDISAVTLCTWSGPRQYDTEAA